MKVEEVGIKKLANEFKSSQVLAEQLSSTRDLAEQFKKATTIKVPDYSNLLPKYNFFKITPFAALFLATTSPLLKLTASTYSKAANLHFNI